MNKVFTDKQLELMRLWKRSQLRRINILVGAVRSGKTWISLVLWAFYVATMPQDAAYLMVGKTLTSLRRNCLDLLQALVGARNFQYSIPSKEGRLFGRLIYLEGVNDSRAESKIRGMTLQGAYCDELTLFSKDFFVMLLSRLSLPGAKLIGTTNPDTPHHWLMDEYIKRQDELDMLVMPFSIEDNTFLDAEYVESLKREYTGVFYDRFIRGLWVAAEGVIYQQFADNPEKYIITEPLQIALGTIGVDFGGNGSATTFCLTGLPRGLGQVVILDEYYKKGIQSPSELERDFIMFAERNLAKFHIAEVYCDSAEQTLIQGLKIAVQREGLPLRIRNAEKGPINDRIRFYTSMMAQGRFLIMDHCKHTIDALQSAVWDSKVLTRDVRLDNGSYNVDSLDAMEYSTERYMKDILRAGGQRIDNPGIPIERRIQSS